MRLRTGRARNYIDFGANIGSARVDTGTFVKETGHGSAVTITSLDVLENPTTASTTHTCTLAVIPAGSLVLAVTAKVDPTGVLASSATWSLGISGATTMFGTTIARTAGTTLDSTAVLDLTTAKYFKSATALVLTSSSGNWSTGALGKIRIVITYLTASAPTSTSDIPT